MNSIGLGTDVRLHYKIAGGKTIKTLFPKYDGLRDLHRNGAEVLGAIYG